MSHRFVSRNRGDKMCLMTARANPAIPIVGNINSNAKPELTKASAQKFPVST